MRILMALTLLAGTLSGCILEPGLSRSPTTCTDSVELESGFKITIASDVEPFVGYCMEISASEDPDETVALRKIPPSGVVYLPVTVADRYYVSVSVPWANDPYCADHIGEFAQHPGTGIVELTVNNTPVCS